MVNETHGCATTQNVGHSLSRSQKYCIGSFRALAEDIYLRAPSMKVLGVRDSRGKGGTPKTRTVYVDETATIMSRLKEMAIATPDGPKKARACAELLLKLRATPEAAKSFVGRISGMAYMIDGDDWTDAFERAMKCNPSVDPLKVLSLSLESLSRTKTTKQVKFNPSKEAPDFVAAMEDFVGSLNCGAFEVKLRIRKGIELTPKKEGSSSNPIEELDTGIGMLGRR